MDRLDPGLGPRRILHVGNIANNAYLNAKFLRRVGVEADALSYDYRHVMAQPEWDEADFAGKVDESNPEWDRVDLRGYRRPSWFIDASLASLDSEGQPLQGLARLGYWVERIKVWFAQALERAGFHRNPGQGWCLPRTHVGRIKAALLLPGAALFYGLARLNQRRARARVRLENWRPEQREFLAGLVAAGEIRPDDLSWALPRAARLRGFFGAYDLVQAYGLDPIYALICSGGRPYVAFEHGTMRDLPFEDSPTGRLLTTAYRRAAKVIITNPDVIASARRLGLDNYVFIPHPIDEERCPPVADPGVQRLRQRYGERLVLLAPARQNWAIKGNDRLLRAFARILADGYQAVLLLARWGQEISRSERLIRELGIGAHVQWYTPAHKLELLRMYRACDVVLDQFIIGGFGGVVPEAMACGCPVISHYDDDMQAWAFPVKPPIVQAHRENEIHAALVGLSDASRRHELAESGRRWVAQHHGWRLVVERHLAIYREVFGVDPGPSQRTAAGALA